MREKRTGHRDGFAKKVVMRAVGGTGKEGWRKRWRTSNQRKSMWPVRVSQAWE